MRGKEPVSISELTRLTEIARTTSGAFGYCRALVMAATACRLTARYDEGLLFVTRALEYATAHRFYSMRREILQWTIALHIAAGRFAEAKNTLTQSQHESFSSDSAKERNETLLHEARIALEEGNYERAASAFRQAEPVSPTFSDGRKCYCLALEVRLKLHEGCPTETLRPMVNALEFLNAKLRGVGNREFEFFTLILGLRELGESARAMEMLRDYVASRPVMWPLRKEVRDALAKQDALGREPTVYVQDTAARRTVPLSGVL